jgi:hypothetical protein
MQARSMAKTFPEERSLQRLLDEKHSDDDDLLSPEKSRDYPSSTAARFA